MAIVCPVQLCKLWNTFRFRTMIWYDFIVDQPYRPTSYCQEPPIFMVFSVCSLSDPGGTNRVGYSDSRATKSFHRCGSQQLCGCASVPRGRGEIAGLRFRSGQARQVEDLLIVAWQGFGFRIERHSSRGQ